MSEIRFDSGIFVFFYYLTADLTINLLELNLDFHRDLTSVDLIYHF